MKAEDVKPGMKVIVTDVTVRGHGNEFTVSGINHDPFNDGFSRVWMENNVFYYPRQIEPAGPQIVAWQYSLAKARYLDGSGYTDFGPLEISETKPIAPEGSIRDLRPLVYGDVY